MIMTPDVQTSRREQCAHNPSAFLRLVTCFCQVPDSTAQPVATVCLPTLPLLPLLPTCCCLLYRSSSPSSSVALRNEIKALRVQQLCKHAAILAVGTTPKCLALTPYQGNPLKRCKQRPFCTFHHVLAQSSAGLHEGMHTRHSGDNKMSPQDTFLTLWTTEGSDHFACNSVRCNSWTHVRPTFTPGTDSRLSYK